jgi:hypothetical protein
MKYGYLGVIILVIMFGYSYHFYLLNNSKLYLMLMGLSLFVGLLGVYIINKDALRSKKE